MAEYQNIACNYGAVVSSLSKNEPPLYTNTIQTSQKKIIIKATYINLVMKLLHKTYGYKNMH